ncbi:hypothetical protein ABPG77_007489 [Micractinium sp. CCAP 211/92]
MGAPQSDPHGREQDTGRLQGLQGVLRGRRNADGGGGPPAPLPAAKPTVACATPAENYAYHSNAAADKYAYPYPKLAVLGVLAGAYIGLGYSLCCLCAGLLSPDFRKQQPGAFNLLFGIYGFPMGLTLCVVAGADLYTSNCMYSAIAVYEGRYGLLGMLRCLCGSYLCNLVGALLLVGLMVGGEVFEGRGDFVIELAHKKVSHSFGVTLCKGILCNWLVCLAVWQGNMARDLTGGRPCCGACQCMPGLPAAKARPLAGVCTPTQRASEGHRHLACQCPPSSAGKFIGVFLPNSAFVSMGFEHCIANMFLIPLSMCLGSGISVGTFVGKNLVPTTIGNLIGGSVFVGTAYAASFGAPAHWVADLWEAALTGRNRKSRDAPQTTASAAPNGRHQAPSDPSSSFARARSGSANSFNV